MSEATLILIKPDGLKKSLTGNVLTRLAESKLEIVGAKMARVNRELAEEHYKHLKGKPFFEDLMKYIQGEYHNRKKVMALIYWGDDAIVKCRSLAGSTNPEEADPISIRGAYGRITTSGVYENVIHVSSDEKEAEREIKLWFDPDEVIVNLYPTKEEVAEKLRRKVWA